MAPERCKHKPLVAEMLARALREEIARSADPEQAKWASRRQLEPQLWAGPSPKRACGRHTPKRTSLTPGSTEHPPTPPRGRTPPPSPTSAIALRKHECCDIVEKGSSGRTCRCLDSGEESPEEHHVQRLTDITMQNVLEKMTTAQARRRFAPSWAFVAWELDRAWFDGVLDFFFSLQRWPHASQLPRALRLACQVASVCPKELYVQEPFAPVFVFVLRDIDRDWFDWAVDQFFGSGHWPPFKDLPKTLQEACLDVGVARSVDYSSPSVSPTSSNDLLRMRTLPALPEHPTNINTGRKFPTGKAVKKLEQLIERLRAMRTSSCHRLALKDD